jgi:SSS family transporter
LENGGTPGATLAGVPPLLFALLTYVLGQLAVGIAVSRRIRTEDDYLLAGRRMGPWLASGTIFATWFGAETCLGSAGSVYENGLSLGTSEPFAYGLCILFLGFVFAARLWRLGLTTLADFFRTRYSPAVERTAALLMIPTSLLWAAAQIHAFGQVLASTAGLAPLVGITLATGIVLVYAAFGGLLADAVTDLVQGACLILGLVVTLVGVVAATGGIEAALASVPPGHLALLPRTDGSFLALLETWCVPVLGSVVAQELVVRVSASRSERVARGSALAGGAAYVLVGLVPVALGLLGAGILPGLDEPEQVLPELARTHLSTFGYALFAGALVSAILSTVDSTLLVCSSLATHNLVLPFLKTPDERRKLRLARGGVILFGLVAYLLALRSDGVAALVEQASSLGSSGLFVLLVFGLFTRLGGHASGLATLLAGLGVYVLASQAEHPAPFLLSLAASVVAFLACVPWRATAAPTGGP